jgi:hypothetical protein
MQARPRFAAGMRKIRVVVVLIVAAMVAFFAYYLAARP